MGKSQGWQMIRIGSLFAGVGGFELGIERAIPNAHTIWQVEQNPFCQSILRKHWPNATIYDDVRTVGAHNLKPVDILIGGFPCQDISTAGKQRGITNGTRSGLWWEMFRIISNIRPRPRIIILENVANIIRLGGTDVVGALAKIGYNCEWTIISAQQFGAPHIRKRWFCVAYPERYTAPNQKKEGSSNTTSKSGFAVEGEISSQWELRCRKPPIHHNGHNNISHDITNPDGVRSIQTKHRRVNEINNPRPTIQCGRSSGNESTPTHWQRYAPPEPTICTMDDGISRGMDRATRRLHNQQLKALGNAIVPQCSEYIGQLVLRSGLLDDLINQ